jgi:hypothetical protein
MPFGILFMAINLFLSDVVWPALYLEDRLFTWWAVSLGIVIETIFCIWLFRVSVIKALLTTIVVNLASAIVGLLLLPLFGLLWEFHPGILLFKLKISSTFSLPTLIATVLMAGLISATIEYHLIALILRVQRNLRQFLWWFAANVITTLIAFVSLIVHPPRM